MPVTTVIDPVTDSRWAALMRRDEAGTVFHHPAWLALLARQYRYAIEAVCIADGDELRAGLPVARVMSPLTGRRLVALPFSDACPPLVAPGGGDEVRAALARAVGEHAAEARLPLELRAPFPELAGARAAELYHRHVLDLGADARPSSMTRRNIDKARRSGVRVALRTDRAALDVFYALHLQTRRRQGVPTQPKRFIRGFEDLFGRGLGFVAVAELDGAPVAAAVFLGAGRTLTYKYGASDRAALRARPNNLLFAMAIARAREDGYAFLDFGRTDLGHEGLRAFKASWGAREEPLAYTYLGRMPATAGPSRGERALAAVITRSPAVTGRAIGRALYRHAG